MELKIVSRPTFTIVGVKYHGKNEKNEIPQLWQSFGPRMGEIKHEVDPQVAYGVCANVDQETREFDYIAGFQVETVADIPEGMISMEIPEATYAAFTTTLPALGETFRNAYHKWLPEAGHQPTGGPELELYGEEFDAQEPTSTFEVYIPIE
jgi:AraC family transcriptional regulator